MNSSWRLWARTRGFNVSVLSMLARLDLDPWEEAADLASLADGPGNGWRRCWPSFPDVPLVGATRAETTRLLSFLPARKRGPKPGPLVGRHPDARHGTATFDRRDQAGAFYFARWRRGIEDSDAKQTVADQIWILRNSFDGWRTPAAPDGEGCSVYLPVSRGDFAARRCGNHRCRAALALGRDG